MVVGATGNVGTVVVEVLRQAGHHVVGVTRRRPPEAPPYDGLPWHTVDVADESAAGLLTAAFAGADSVVNLAWGFQPARDREYLRRVGVGGTRAVVAACSSAEVPHLVHMSSVGAYSSAPRGVRQDESYATNGVESSAYSVDKAAAERVLDEHAAADDGPAVCRLRPGLIMRRQAGSSLLRYGLPAWLPAGIVDLAVVLPWDKSFSVPIVHTRDVAEAIRLAVERRATGPFNLAADTPLTAELLAKALRARLIPVPWKLIRAVVAAGFQARLSRLDPGWIDLAFSVPLLDTARARAELDWAPVVPTEAVIREVVRGMSAAAAGSSPPLRDRTVAGELRDLLTRGPIAHRQRA